MKSLGKRVSCYSATVQQMAGAPKITGNWWFSHCDGRSFQFWSMASSSSGEDSSGQRQQSPSCHIENGYVNFKTTCRETDLITITWIDQVIYFNFELIKIKSFHLSKQLDLSIPMLPESGRNDWKYCSWKFKLYHCAWLTPSIGLDVRTSIPRSTGGDKVSGCFSPTHYFK